jgi:heme-degrading monooxygenase HmoA
MSMYGAIREYTIQPGKADEIVARVRAEFVPKIESAPGFLSYSLALTGDDRILTASAFETKEQAEASVKTASGWVNERLASLVKGPPRVTMGEIVVRHIVDRANAGYGVMRRFETTRSDANRITTLVRDELVPMLRGLAGFAGYSLLFESTHDRGLSLTAFADRATAEAANKKSARMGPGTPG